MSKAAGKTEYIGCFQYHLTVKLIPTDLSHIGRYKLVAKEASAVAPTQEELLTGAGIYRWVSQDRTSDINIAYDITSTIKNYVKTNIENVGGVQLDFDEDQMKELFLSPNTKYKLYATAVDKYEKAKDNKVLEVLSTSTNTLFTDATDDSTDIITTPSTTTLLEGCQYLNPRRTATVSHTSRGNIWTQKASVITRYDPSDDAVVPAIWGFRGTTLITDWYVGTTQIVRMYASDLSILPTVLAPNDISLDLGFVLHPNAKSAAYGNQRYSFVFPANKLAQTAGVMDVSVARVGDSDLFGTVTLQIDDEPLP